MTEVWDLKAEFEKYRDQDVFDCLLAEYILSEGRFTLDLESTLTRYDVTSLSALAAKQQLAFTNFPALQKLYQNIELPLVPILYSMEQHGISLDKKQLLSVGQELDKAITELKTQLESEMGEINLSSPAQVGRTLVEKFYVPLKKTPSGQYATGEPLLAGLKKDFPILSDLLKYRGLVKLKTTYIDTLIEKIDSKGKVHTTYTQAFVTTGRLSSSNPNLQNIPTTSEYGKLIKACFVATPGYELLAFDYSQQELRILAHLTKEEKLAEAFKEGKDIHTVTASQIFHVPYEDVSKEQRYTAKTINFGIIYGMSSYGMSQVLDITPKEAELFIQNFYATFPRIESYFETLLKNGLKDNYIETILGRRRFVYMTPTAPKFIDNGTRRVLINFPVQGSAADLMKKAMVDLATDVLPHFPKVRLLLQIHDELVFEVPTKTDKAEFIEKVRKTMCEVFPLTVPLEVTPKIGTTWGTLEPVTL